MEMTPEQIEAAIQNGYYCDEYMCYFVEVITKTETAVTLEFDPDVDYLTEPSIETFKF